MPMSDIPVNVEADQAGTDTRHTTTTAGQSSGQTEFLLLSKSLCRRDAGSSVRGQQTGDERYQRHETGGATERQNAQSRDVEQNSLHSFPG